MFSTDILVLMWVGAMTDDWIDVLLRTVNGVVPLSCANGILAGLWAGSMFLATMSMGVRVDAMVDDWIGVLERRTSGVVPDIGLRADVDASL